MKTVNAKQLTSSQSFTDSRPRAFRDTLDLANVDLAFESYAAVVCAASMVAGEGGGGRLAKGF